MNKLILVVEDSNEDFETLNRVMKELKLDYPIYRVCDGDEALEYLYYSRPYHRPCMILMDLNLPGTDGRDVIRDIKQNKKLKKIPIIVLTTSSSSEDIESCYSNGANSYMIKPMGVENLKIIVRDLFNYWFETAVIPFEDK